MDAAKCLLSSPPALNSPRNPPRNPLSSVSVPVLHDQASQGVPGVPTKSVFRHFPASVLAEEQRDDCRSSYYVIDEMLFKHEKDGLSVSEEKKKHKFEEYSKYFESQLLHQPGFWYLFPLPYALEKSLMAMSADSVANDTNKLSCIGPLYVKQNNPNCASPEDVLALAKRAMVASRNAASLAENSTILEAEYNDSCSVCFNPMDSAEEILIEKAKVRSNRHLERQLKKRKVSKNPGDDIYKITRSKASDMNRKIDYDREQSDPLRLFLSGPQTKQLLTVKEERDLFSQTQNLMRLNEVKERLQIEFNHEPTVAEWAQAVGMSCQDLRSSLHSGNQSRDKLLYANFLLVVHIAKQYEGKGLDLQDLLQEGSMGLMKSLEKFKPKAGCRFPSYAYWWIRQSIRKAIFLKSRIIRLPDNVHALLKTIKNTRMACIREGHFPTNEELARRVGIASDRLESLLSLSRNPISIQDRAWADQDVTVQEITADPEVENPALSFAKQTMRQHVHGLLRTLKPRERQIIQFRYGIHDGKPKSLSEIGDMFGLSRERIRQLETRAMDKLKACLPSHGLKAYVDLLT